MAGPDAAGTEMVGPAAAGTEMAGPDAAGPDAAGTEMAGPDAAGPDAAGTEIAGPGTAGPDTADPHTAGTDTAGPDTDLPTSLTQLTFHGPLSEARAGRLVDRLTRGRPASVLDIGCGWSELMLRIVAVLPDATGFGFDTDAGDLARARETARARGLSERVTFVQESGVGTTRGPADLVLCVGSSHALTEAEPPESVPAALAILRRLVTPGGRVLLGEGFWQRPPTEAELAAMWPGMTGAEFPGLAGLVDLTVDAGFRPAWIETATLQEWEEFESGYQCDEEEWLASHADHPEAARIREQVDEHRSYWLRGYRGILGQAYLTLVPVG
jgi:cyclopropane fatty-acyl-phospholipid synthase-like methyltransferase